MLRWLLKAARSDQRASKAERSSGTRVGTDRDRIRGELEAALQHHRAGRFSEAEAGYRKVLALDPENLDALHFLGVIAYQQKDYDRAVHLISTALSLHPANPPAHNNLGNTYAAQGKVKEALGCFLSALAFDPKYVDAYVNMGATFRAQGKLDRAIACYRQALALDPGAPAALHGLDSALKDRSAIERTAAQGPYARPAETGAARALVEQGTAFLARGEVSDAIASFRSALSLSPDFPDAHFNLGNAYKDKGRLDDAVASYAKAVSLAPDFPAAYVNQGNVLGALGKSGDAITCFRKAIALEPDLVEAHYNLANTLQEEGKASEAIIHYERVLALRPDFVHAFYNLGQVFRNQGRRDDALECYRRALALDPGFIEARWAIAMSQIPRMYGAAHEQQECRAAFARELLGLERWFTENGSENGFRAVGSQQPFSLAYQEENNRDLLQRYGRLCGRLMGEWYERQHFALIRRSEEDGFIRVGVVSQYFWNHSVWKAIVKGWFQQIDTQRFSLFAFCLGNREDEETLVARARSAHFDTGQRDLRAWVEAIRAKQPDVLIYPEIGMDPTAVKLASLRLAPVQIATWGHPETTGLPTIDYFLSGEDFEPANAQDGYSERLVSLPHLGCFYQPWKSDAIAPDLDRLRIDPHAPLIVCPGMPFKYAPQYDWIFVDIARALGRCQLIFFQADTDGLSEKLKKRLEAEFARSGLDMNDFVRFVPWQSGPEFDGLLERAAICLDTIGFSGFNTAMQAVERGLPVVVREGRYLRGRLASGILKRMGLDELVAQSEKDYVALAVELVRDRKYRDRIRRRIEDNRRVLFEDIEPIRALEQFMIAAVGRLRTYRS